MSSTPASILIVGMNYAPELAGVGRYTGDLGAELADRGHSVTVITSPPHYPGWKIDPAFRNWYSHQKEARIRIYRCPILIRQAMHGIWRFIAPVSFAITSAPIIIWSILIQRPAVVMCVEPTLLCAPVVLLAAALTSSRTVLHVQDLEIDAAFAVGHLPSNGWLKGLSHWFERICLTRFKKIVTISKRMGEKLVEKGVSPERIEIIYNWVDLDHITPQPRDLNYREELGLNSMQFVLLYSGNIGAKQGLDLLLTAMSQLTEIKDVICVIAGEGPSKAKLKERWDWLPNVVFVSFQPYERLSEFLSIADLHIVPQEPDAADLVLPSKLGAILASGRPLLVTAQLNTELADFLKGVGTIVPPRDANALAEAIVASKTNAVDKGIQTGSRELAAILSRDNAMSRFASALTDT